MLFCFFITVIYRVHRADMPIIESPLIEWCEKVRGSSPRIYHLFTHRDQGWTKHSMLCQHHFIKNCLTSSVSVCSPLHHIFLLIIASFLFKRFPLC